MSRRANGEGTIYKTANGRWRVVVSVRVAGKLHRLTKITKSKADAVVVLSELRAKIGTGAGPSAGTVGEYLSRWLATSIKPSLAVHTYASYERSIRLHIAPRIGKLKLARLSAMHLEEFKAAMIADKVGPRARQSAYAVLVRALRHAVYPLRMIPANPAEGIKPVQHTKKKMQPFEAEEVKVILEDSAGTRFHALYAMAFGCGLRAGELFGLKWDDIDFIAGKVSVERQAIDLGGHVSIKAPKTRSSIRTITMPTMTINALKAHRAIQMKAGLAGCEWIFPTLSGGLMGRSNFYNDEWKIRLMRCCLKHRGLHNTRHTFATLALLNGTPVAVVAKDLGHSSPAITHGVYSHVLPSAERGSSDTMDRLFG